MAESESDQQHEPQGKSKGELLAAKKAAKAAKKAAKRGRQAEVRESEAIRATAVAADWARENRHVLWGTIGALVVLIGGIVGWSYWRSSQSSEASGLLWEGARAANAPLEGTAAAAVTDQETYTSAKARAETSAERFDQVLDQYPRSTASTWARLGKANALLQEGQAKQARKVFSKALDDAETVPQKWRALEGLAQTYEADKNWAEAIRQYQAMEKLDDPRIGVAARFDLARMKLALGKKDEATKALKELRGDLHKDDAPQLPGLSSRVDGLLSYLDPGAVPMASAESAGGGPQLSPEQIQKLLKQLQAAGAGGGGAGGGGE